jgi:hypothetical protein
MGMDLIRRIKVQRLGFNAAGVPRLTGKGSFDRGSNLILAVGLRSGGPGRKRAAGAAHGRRQCGTRRRRDGERRRSGGKGAGVHQSMRGLHRDDDERLANPLVTLSCGDGEGRRRAASNRGSRAPATTARRRSARATKRAAPGGPLPNGGVTKTTARRWEVVTARVDGGGANLGLWAVAAQGR